MSKGASSSSSGDSVATPDTFRSTGINRVSPTTLSHSDSNRWSDVVPPKTALTFAVIWDEEDDMLAFSGAQLLDSSQIDDSKSLDSPSDAYDNRSQVLTIGTGTIPHSEHTATLAFFRDNHDFLFTSRSRTPMLDRPGAGRTQTSSTLEGLDVYLRGSMLGKAHGNNRHFSCMEDLDADFDFDPRTSFAKVWLRDMKKDRDDVSDEGFFETPQLADRPDSSRRAEHGHDRRNSTVSANSEATSEFVSVAFDDAASSIWSTLEAPDIPNFSELPTIDQQRHVARRLRKRRPADIPARPSEVLQRERYSHNVPLPAPALERKASDDSGTSLVLPKFVRDLTKCKKDDGAERWVCVEISQEITQRYL